MDVRHLITDILLLQIILNLIHIRHIEIFQLAQFIFQLNVHPPCRNILVLVHDHISQIIARHQLLKFLPVYLFFLLVELIGQPQYDKQKYY